jgi:hypothetical protein
MESLPEGDPEVHRWLGAQLFNRTWDLIDKVDRSGDDDTEMLLAAMASRWHWGQVGTVEQVATGDWQVAHVFGLVGDPEVVVRFARRHLAAATAEGWDGWRLASAHEGMARALAVAGDASGRAQQMEAADAALAREGDAEDRDAIAAQLATVPPVSPL